MSNSRIEWTEETLNPTVGSNKVSAGCANCYAEIMAKRLQAMGVHGYENGFEFTILDERLEQPLTKKKPTKYFANSMSDLFHEKMPEDFLDKIFSVIKESHQHIYQILTKREKRMFEYLNGKEIPNNIWLGVTVENRKDGLPLIEKLRKLKANFQMQMSTRV